MTKLELFIKACQARSYRHRSWLVTAFSVAESPTDPAYEYPIYRTPTGVYTVINGTNHPIEEADPSEPLYRFLDKIQVTPDWCPNATQPIESTYGTALVNLIALVECFGKIIPYQSGRLSVPAIENLIADLLTDDPEDGIKQPGVLYVQDYIRFVDAMMFLTGLTQLCVQPGTAKVITLAPGIKEYKAQLLAEYGDRIHDPVALVEIEEKLQAYDNAYLADDPSNGIFMSGKVKNIGRKKMHLMLGEEMGFGDTLVTNPVTNSLADGWPKDIKQQTAMLNAIRFGSYSRGKETQKGGTTLKVFLRAGNNFQVLPDPCETKHGIRRILTHSMVKRLIGRYYQKGSQWIKIESPEQLQDMVGHSIVLRSPMYCLLPSDRICSACVGERLSLHPKGLATSLTEVSSMILLASMKMMHGVKMETTQLDLSDVFS